MELVRKRRYSLLLRALTSQSGRLIFMYNDENFTEVHHLFTLLKTDITQIVLQKSLHRNTL